MLRLKTDCFTNYRDKRWIFTSETSVQQLHLPFVNRCSSGYEENCLSMIDVKTIKKYRSTMKGSITVVLPNEIYSVVCFLKYAPHNRKCPTVWWTQDFGTSFLYYHANPGVSRVYSDVCGEPDSMTSGPVLSHWSPVIRKSLICLLSDMDFCQENLTTNDRHKYCTRYIQSPLTKNHQRTVSLHNGH